MSLLFFVGNSLIAWCSNHNANLRIPDIRCWMGIRFLRNRWNRSGMESAVVCPGVWFTVAASENFGGRTKRNRGGYWYHFDDKSKRQMMVALVESDSFKILCWNVAFLAASRSLESNLYLDSSMGHHNNPRLQRLRILHSRKSTSNLHEVHTQFQHKSGKYLHPGSTGANFIQIRSDGLLMIIERPFVFSSVFG